MDRACLSISGCCAGRIALPVAAMDRLMPMHLHLSASGRITALGPTLAKIAAQAKIGAGGGLTGQDFFQLFEVRRPAGVAGMADLSARQGERLHLGMRGGDVAFRGLAMADVSGGIVLNLSFGIGVAEAVRAHALTDADFAATDLTVELLYLAEVKRMVLGELQRLNQRLQGAKTQAEEQALTDTLTGLRNRRALDLRLAQAVVAGAPFALLRLDLDRFKAVNDTLGHAAGDHILRMVAQVLLAETRSGDLVARVGGDEFVILLPDLIRMPRLIAVAERIIAAIAQPVAFEGQVCQIGASVGLTVSTFYASLTGEEMLQDADAALYAAKRDGRGRVVPFLR
ncbi:GGDEF domain-containing protein [Pseudotabrizicola sp. 4114]|uniref:GGDEF domain-containing protein n=1 Tax=Pseudotabrizicola sp. 4114 TaxID=2817731 RepID=UPI0028547D4D|nr:diguanylate cyclase (GGDEF)-like protein [Pseudorhodobacter sp. 4114]